MLTLPEVIGCSCLVLECGWRTLTVLVCESRYASTRTCCCSCLARCCCTLLISLCCDAPAAAAGELNACTAAD